jgi:hypothetical protein
MTTSLTRGMRWLRTHWIFALLVAVGALLRLLVILGERPILWFGGDSDLYVRAAADLVPSTSHPAGYSLFLRLLQPIHDFVVVALVQHALGLMVGILIYLLLIRPLGEDSVTAEHRALPRWLAALAAAPVLLNAYQLQLEHLVMSDILFEALIVLALVLLVWQHKPNVAQATAALLMLGYATITRSVGLPIVLLALGYLFLRRVGWRVLVTAAAALVLPLASYAAWFHVHHGAYSLTASDGLYLWSRTATFADCNRLSLSVEERVLCPDRSSPDIPRPQPAASQWLWHRWSPLRQAPASELGDLERNALARRFAIHAITGQPGAYANAVARDVMLSFAWERAAHPGAYTVSFYEFPTEDRPLPTEHSAASLSTAQVAHLYAPMTGTQAVKPYASWIAAYQDVVYLRGPLLALILLIGFAGIVRAWRAFGGAALLPWAVAVALLVIPPMLADFDHRYVLPAIPPACLAAGMSIRDRGALKRTQRDGSSATVDDASRENAQPASTAGAPSSGSRLPLR